jgi:hypothetical protein
MVGLAPSMSCQLQARLKRQPAMVCRLACVCVSSSSGLAEPLAEALMRGLLFRFVIGEGFVGGDVALLEAGRAEARPAGY